VTDKDASSEVVLVADYEDAIVEIQKGNINRIITDGLGGDYSKIIDESDEIPVIVVTANPSYKADVEKRGARFFLKQKLSSNDL
jgi:hypothetical protein